MIRRSTWILLMIFLVLIGFAFFYQKYQANKTASVTTAPTVVRVNLYDFDSSQVNEVKIADSSGNQIGLHRDASTATWSVSDLPADQSNSFQIESVMAQLFAAQIVDTLTKAVPIDSVGLESPTYTIIIDKVDGNQIITNIGAPTAIDNGYYVRIGDGPVVIVNKLELDNVLNLLSNPPLVATPTPAEAIPSQVEPGVTPTQ